ncbi:MAG: DUF4159 domain-containing protein [Myxococcales bacterium]|nr:DUF4159 domain-containing protein [Myxococcales bacterium]
MKRRVFLRGLAAATASTALLSRRAFAIGDEARLRIGQIVYDGGEWNPRPRAISGLLREVERRTSIIVDPDPRPIRVADRDLFEYPLLYIAGLEGFAPWAETDVERLRRFLDAGGMLVADDAMGRAGWGFDESFRRELARVYPGTDLVALDPDHTIYRSFYLLDRPSGRQLRKPYLEGIVRGDRAPVVYSQNDLGGAWATDRFGRPVYQTVGGGARQRELALRLGVNLVLYALTLDYKRDQIHIPFILRRRKV